MNNTEKAQHIVEKLMGYKAPSINPREILHE